MTNSTPHVVAWMVEYQKYIDLVDRDVLDAASGLKLVIEKGLHWLNLTWADP